MSRRRRWIVIALATAAVIAAVVVRQVVTHYEPLSMGTTAFHDSNAVEAPGDPGTYHAPVYRVEYRQGEKTSIGFTVRNSGRWAVTITELPILHDSAHVLLKFVTAEVGDRVLSNRGAGAFTPDQLSPFTPFPLPAGEQRFIKLTGTFTDCEWYEAGGGNLFSQVAVRYRFWWSTGVTSIELPFSLEVVSPPDTDCPVGREPIRGDARKSPSPPPVASPSA